MPRPTPDIVPGELREEIARLGYAGIMEYSEHIGLNPQRLLSNFAGKHSKLRPYVALAEYAGITLDQLAGKMASGEIGSFIEQLAKRDGISVRALSLKIGASENFLHQRIKGGIYLNGLQGYIEVAHALGWTLDRWAKVCLRKGD